MINEKIAWLEENTDAYAEELQAQKKEMDDIIQPIIPKLYQVGWLKSYGLVSHFSIEACNNVLF